MKRFWLLLIVSFLSLQCLNAQEQDTLQMSPREDSLYFNQPPESTNSVVLKKKHSPKKATLLALIPGAGQAYNKKYWKIPIVYAGFGVTTYFAITNGDDYKLYKLAYDYKMGYTTNVSDRVKAEAAKYSADNHSARLLSRQNGTVLDFDRSMVRSANHRRQRRRPFLLLRHLR